MLLRSMLITAINRQQKRSDRYSIFVDNKYSFSLSESELLASGIKIGKEYSPEEFEQLKQTAVLDKAYMRALDLLARRARSEWELRDYLKRKDYSPEVIEEIILKLRSRGHINDAAFAKAWVENRRLLKSISKRKLKLELKQKRISDEIITAVLAEDETDETEVVRELVAKKRNQTKYQDNLKLMQYLSRQGFNYDVIKEVIGE